MTTAQNFNQLSRYRRLTSYRQIGAVILLLLMVSCKKEKEIVPSSKNDYSSTTGGNITQSSAGNICGTPSVNILYAGQKINAGSVTISNDPENIYVTYKTTDGWNLIHTHLYVGLLENVPLNNAGNPQIGLFPNQTNHGSGITEFTYTLPLKNLPDCFVVAAHAEVQQKDPNGNILQTQTGWGNGTSFTQKGSWAMYMNYCKQICQTACTINAGDFHTQTQGAWGAMPNGNNWGSYLHQHFAEVFPSGVFIGSNYKATFSSADAITVFLPQGGTPTLLNNNYNDPIDLKNVFAGQVLTLTLSIGFSKHDPNFQKSSASLEDLKVKEGTFAGKSVKEILEEANRVLGGTSQNYSPSEMNFIITSINENFDNGNTNKNFLVCP